jgi:hypothetical protein
MQAEKGGEVAVVFPVDVVFKFDFLHRGLNHYEHFEQADAGLNEQLGFSIITGEALRDRVTTSPRIVRPKNGSFGFLFLRTGGFPSQIVGVQFNPVGSIWGPKHSIFKSDSSRLAV